MATHLPSTEDEEDLASFLHKVDDIGMLQIFVG